MSNEIRNRVAESSLEIFDLEDYFPKENIVIFDITQWLYQGFILREKEFREQVKNHGWQQYKNTLVGLICSSEAIVPHWAYMLLISKLLPYTKKVVKGNEKELLLAYYTEFLPSIDYSKFQNKPVIIKGCSKKQVPEEVYLLAMKYIQPYAKSIMYGEACSAVPIFKK